jgi:hypothetical protein
LKGFVTLLKIGCGIVQIRSYNHAAATTSCHVCSALWDFDDSPEWKVHHIYQAMAAAKSGETTAQAGAKSLEGPQ